MHELITASESRHRRSVALARAQAHRQRVALEVDPASVALRAVLRVVDGVRRHHETRRRDAAASTPVCEFPVRVRPA